MKMKSVLLIVFITIWTIITILALTWGNRFDWPDNVHINYGFPLVWSTQTLSTISGAVNIWTVDITALTTNLIFWLGIQLIISLIIIYFVNKKE